MLLNQEMGCGSVFLFFAFEAGVRDLLLHTPASPTPQFTLVLFFWLCWRNGLRGYAVNSSLKISLQKPQVLSFPSPFYGTVLWFYWHTSESDKSQQKSRSLWEKRDRQHLQQHSHANKMYMEAHSEAFSSLFQKQHQVKDQPSPAVSDWLFTVPSLCQTLWSLTPLSCPRLQMYK